MASWLSQLRFDPIRPLVGSSDGAVRFFAKRDLLSVEDGSIGELWKYPEVLKLLKGQRSDGSWGSSKKTAGSGPKDDRDVKRALEWLAGHQQEDGLWNVSYSSIHKAADKGKSDETRLWVSLSICRILKRYFDGDNAHVSNTGGNSG